MSKSFGVYKASDVDTTLNERSEVMMSEEYEQGMENIPSDSIVKNSERVSVALRFLEGGDRLLDVGCNDGWFLEQCKHPIKTGIDASQKMVDIATAKLHDVFRGVSWALPFGRNRFDRVHFGQTLAHMRKDLGIRSLLEIKRVLKPKGIAVISTKVGPIFRSAMDFMKKGHLLTFLLPDIHIHEWEPPELKAVLEASEFEILEGAIVPSSTKASDHYSFIVKVRKRME